MSVQVDLDQLADALADYSFAYLVTVSDDYRARTLAVNPVLVDGRGLPSGADTSLQIAPTHAVLHRPAPPNSPPSATGCGDDCVPVG
ncbi:pyridoxamine 5'-phosphate oxidase family protein [Mycolicibacterium komossense]|uniref:Pyridoxamine 5'-phosphate oxidase family protein n=1 Tax=Mycolicibacterium komossense TaxID=1779 RepID=A0ABT3CLA9_9MYCO|nr:pyridoxamine 5'-phosphate oxidase family protein [Mycolicibacterium komossense]MCV7230225.1 pyridoxamine 5'-phosphate oxidase family protein [Mycolicibacterium komossense]